jgi:PKD repeat protein
MTPFGLRFRSAAALAAIAALVGVSLATAPAALADTDPADTTLPATVTADVLPTVQVDGVVWKQVIVGNTVYVAGNFANARPAGAAPGTQLTPRSHMLAYNLTTGALITSFAPTFNAQVRDLAVSPDGKRLYAVGNFTTVNGANRYRFAALDLPSGQLSPGFTTGTNAYITAVAATSTTVYLGGAFDSVGTAGQSRIGAVSATNGAVVPFNAAVNVVAGQTQVNDIAVAPDGQSIVIAGNFTSVAGSNSPGYGLARLNATTGASMPFAANSAVRNAGASAAMVSLESDGELLYGTGYHFGGGGNVEGTWAARWDTGELVWVEDCHGDTYSAYPVGDVVYQASHKHYCGNSGGFPQTEPWNFYHSTAVTKKVRGTNTPDMYGYQHHSGRPRPELLEWYPEWSVGTFTGKSQATWTVTGNSDYVLYGGEFPRVNNVPQQGLARFARVGIAPDTQGPVQKGSFYPLSARSDSSGEVRLAWRGNPDRDSATLTYSLYRNSTTAAPIHTQTVTAPFWKQPVMSFVDAGQTPGSTPRYRVIVRDSAGNEAMSDWTTVTVTGDERGAYATSVLDDGARSYWRLSESSGTTVADWAGGQHATAGSGVTRGAAGALVGDANSASTFSGSATGLASTVTDTGVPVVAPDDFAVEAWFRTTTATGGKIVGFGNRSPGVSTGVSTQFDRHIYMANDGRLLFGVRGTAASTITSTARYNDGAWHHVVGTLGDDGMRLFVDGAQIGAGNAAVTAGQAYPGEWRIGGDNLDGWNLRPTSRYFAGQIDEVAVYGAPLTPAQVARHHALGKGTGTPNAAPVASFTASPSNLTLAVDGSASSDPDGTIASYAWTFGDGTTGTGVRASKTYAAAGTYTVTLTVTDNGGRTATSSRQVTVSAAPNAAPVASFTASPSNLTLAVDGSASSDADGTIASYAWTFGDGTTGTGVTASKTYAAAGTYTVTLTVTDNGGRTATSSRQVTVSAAPNAAPVASFTASPTDLTVAVDGSASSDADGTIASHAWTFGDGTTGTGATTSKTYAAAGTYTVTLTVTDDRGTTATTSRTVTVTSPAGPPLFASDTFTRSVPSAWGTADQGGAWTLSGSTGTFAVANGVGTMRMAAGASPKAQLAAVAQRDVDLRSRVTLDRIGNGGGTFVSLAARASGWSSDYRAKVWVRATGGVNLELTRSAGSETSMRAVAVSGLTLAAGETLEVRFQATGANPTTLRAKVWKAGQAEPATWQATVTDSTAGLQDAGAVGVVGYLSSASTVTPVTVSLDELRAGPVVP